MVLKIVFLKYILKTLIFKKAFFKTAYSNIPLLKKKAQIYLGKKKSSLTPLPPSLTCNYPFASTTCQFATPNSCLSRSQTPIQASKFQPYSLCRCVFFFFFWLNYKCISFSLFMHVSLKEIVQFMLLRIESSTTFYWFCCGLRLASIIILQF